MESVHDFFKGTPVVNVLFSVALWTACPSSLSMSVSVFVFAKQVRWERVFSTQRRDKILSTLAGGSFGVYLMHMAFFWYALLVTGMNGGYLFWRTVMPFIVYAACARA